MNRMAASLSALLILVVMMGACGGGGSPSVTLTFPGGKALAIDQGQNVTINVTATNDGGMGVTWACSGAACTTLANVTTTAVTFNASGTTGTATITATSKSQANVSGSVVVTVSALPTISTTQAQVTAAPGSAGVAYNFALAVTGGAGAITWTATGLPADGLSINASTGAITGTPTAKGSVTFTATATDSSAAGHQSSSLQLTITVNNPAPPAITTTQAQLTAAPATAGTAYAGFTFHATGTGTLTWSATGLPADGLSLSATGVLAGTPTSKASISIMVTVSDTFGQSSTATPFTITVNNPPAPAIATTQAQLTAKPATVGSPYSFTFAGTGSGTLTWSAAGLPADGLSLNSSTGVVSGTPTTQTTISITLTLSDTFGQSSAATAFTITVDSPPAITSGNNATFTVGAAGTFSVTTTGVPTPTLSETGALPSGVTFVGNGNGTATLSGTPAASTGGVYTITIKATNVVATTPQTFTLTVNQAPVFSSANNATFTVGALGTFTVTAAGPPRPSLSETGALPSGVTFIDNGNGTATLSGTPGAGTGGTYSITINAANIVGTTPQSFTLTVNTAPVFTSASSTTFTVGTAGSFTVVASGTPAPTLSQTAGTLPTGVTFNASTGVLSGTPGAGTGGTYSITFKATNTSGSTNQTFTLTVDQTPAVTSVNNTTFTVGAAGTFQVTTSGFPAPAISDNGAALPSGVTFVDNGNGTGTLSGTPGSGTAGSYPITFTPNNGVGTPAGQSFTLTVNLAPVFTSGTSTTFTAGTAGTFTVMVSGTPTPTLSETGTLPSGVTFLDNHNGTGTLSGTPAAGTGGVFTITIKATNTGGTTQQTFTLTVNQFPFFTSSNNTTFTVGTSNTFTVTAVGPPAVTSLSDNSATLPSGVTYVDNGNGTGTLSGTPASGTQGTTTITFTATNSLGSTSQTFTLTVAVAAVNCAGAPTGHESSFKGRYLFLFQGWNGNGGATPYPQAYVASFAPDGLGNISDLGSGVGGEVDTNDPVNGPVNFNLNSTSTNAAALYKVGADPTGSGDVGCVVLASTSQGGSATFRFSLGKKNASGIYTKGRIIEFDDATGTQSRGSGVMLLQTITSTIQAQSLAFGASGFDSAGGPVASGGFFTVSSGGSITNLTVDFDDAGTVDQGLTGPILGFASNNGFISAPDTIAGRSTALVNLQIGANTSSSHFARYQVDANEYFYISTDAVATSVLLAGRMIATGSLGSFSNSSLGGNYVIHLTGNGGGVANVNIGLVTLSSGSLNGTLFNYQAGGGASTSQTVSGNYAVNKNTGRTVLSGANLGNHPPILYVSAPNSTTEPVSAFLVGTDGSATFGLAEASSGTFTTAGLAGNYFFGTENPGDNSVSNNVGVVTIASSGAVTGTQYKSGNGGLSTGSVSGSSFAITNSNGIGNLGANTVAITNGESIFFFDEGSPAGSSSAKINVVERQ